MLLSMSLITQQVGNRDSGVAYFKIPLFHTLLSDENQGVAKYKSEIQMYTKS